MCCSMCSSISRLASSITSLTLSSNHVFLSSSHFAPSKRLARESSRYLPESASASNCVSKAEWSACLQPIPAPFPPSDALEMAFLLPLAIPAIANVTTNIGIGVSNALQSTDSSVTFQLGKYVFSTNKGFRLTDLPYELREKIILMALAESRSYAQLVFCDCSDSHLAD